MRLALPIALVVMLIACGSSDSLNAYWRWTETTAVVVA